MGLRTTLILDRLLMDVSYGDQLGDRVDGNRIELVVGLGLETADRALFFRALPPDYAAERSPPSGRSSGPAT